jgi:hypothetical protein
MPGLKDGIDYPYTPEQEKKLKPGWMNYYHVMYPIV